MARQKSEMIETVRRLVRESLQLRAQGAVATRAARAQGYADGYMRMMLDNDVVTQTELLTIVMSERSRVEGPATAVSAPEALPA